LTSGGGITNLVGELQINRLTGFKIDLEDH
jgi:hypothetical protein